MMLMAFHGFPIRNCPPFACFAMRVDFVIYYKPLPVLCGVGEGVFAPDEEIEISPDV